MTGGFGTVAPRPPEALARKLRLRAERGIDHFRAEVEAGPAFLCPVCGYEGRFAPVRSTPGLWCPGCDSRPRHRLLKLWMDRDFRPGPAARVLHFAPEPWLAALLAPRVAEYVTADLREGCDLRLDITAMDLPGARFDIVIANHVLEHVDDRAALSEIARVLAPGGLAILTFPVVEGWEATHEDAGLSDPADRHRQFLDPLHLRLYGRDAPARIAAAGFLVTSVAATEPEVSRHGLQRGERLFLARRPGGRP